MKRKMMLAASAVCAVIAGCAAPRSITQSGRVTPHREWRPGAQLSLSASTIAPGALLDGLESAVDDIVDDTQPEYDEKFNDVLKAAVAQSLDPAFSAGYGFSLRYGILPRLDAGYRWQSGTHVLDTRLQFLGDPGETADSTDAEQTQWAGAVGLQFSSQSAELPSFAGLDKLGDLLGFHIGRKEILIPVTVSYPLGDGERYGAVAFGAVAGYCWIDYGLEPHDIIVHAADGTAEAARAVSHSQSFPAYGGFFHIKVGYKRVFVGAGVAVYYQDYGTYKLLGNFEESFSGVTIAPTLDIEVRI